MWGGAGEECGEELGRSEGEELVRSVGRGW